MLNALLEIQWPTIRKYEDGQFKCHSWKNEQQAHSIEQSFLFCNMRKIVYLLKLHN